MFLWRCDVPNGCFLTTYNDKERSVYCHYHDRLFSGQSAIIQHNLRCPIQKFLKLIPSTYHLKMKFFTKVRVGEVHDEEVIVRECYVEELKSGEKGQMIDKTLVFERLAASTLGRLKQMSL